MTRIRLAEAVRDACEDYINSGKGSECDVFHDLTGIDLQTILVAHAHPKPVAHEEVQRFSASKDDPNAFYPDSAGSWVRYTDWQRTEAARLAAEQELASLKDAENLPVKYYKEGGITYAVYGSSSIDYAEWLRTQLAAERERSASSNRS